MFQKRKVAFKNQDIFGANFQPAVDPCFCMVSKMLFHGKIEIDGTLDISKEVMFSKKELWSYIYYLYYHNHTNMEIFQKMKDRKSGKASAEKFYETIYGDATIIQSVDVTSLVLFINNLIRSNEELVNPVIDYLKVIIQKNIMSRISGVSVITGKDGKSGFEIVTNPKEAEQANVKISLSS
jgi:hypothetical protein